MKKISVIIPVYNAEKYIDVTLSNVASQTLQDIEILCVDDGSSDRSAEMIKEKIKNDNRIRYFYRDNAGAGMARNLGMENAEGEFIAFMDADDSYPDNDTLEYLYEKAKENNALICGGSCLNENGTTKDGKRGFHNDGFIKYEDYQFDYLFPRFIFSRALIQNNDLHFPPYRVYEDPVFLVNAMVCAQKFYAVSRPVYLYTGSHQSVNMNIGKLKDFIRGITDNLSISTEFGLAELHKSTFEHLATEASYYAELLLDKADNELISLLMKANLSVNKQLLYSVGININKDYLLPCFESLLSSGKKYSKIRNSRPIKIIRTFFGRK